MVMKRVWSLVTIATLLMGSSQVMAQSQKAGDPCVKAALDKLGLKYEVDEDGDFKVGLRLSDGRTQVGWITSSTEKLDTLEIRQVISLGYRSQAAISGEVANRLLADNARRKIGAWQTFQNDKGSTAWFSAKISTSMSADELGKTIEAVLSSADEMEKELTNKDDF